ncbi:hypothetical protein [Streptomyces sp. NPDC002088]|uniref:hypothetical protein n=1 Tax=Streptomyces sp. NPDC002088 TaxID=3154665 RepID=UPI0033222B78
MTGASGVLTYGTVYRSELAATPDSTASWTGFALAWSSLGPTPGAELRRPALVQAVHRRLRALGEPPEPDALATWLATHWPPATPHHT